MGAATELLISAIIILCSMIYTEMIFKKNDPDDLDIEKELKERWLGSKENFIEYKKFQYSRAFSLISEIQPFMTFSLTIGLLGLKEILIPLIGSTIYISLVIAAMIPLGRLVRVLGSANKKATDNMKKLYLK